MLLFFGYQTYMGMEIFKKDVVIFGYQTYMGMEIFKKNVVFFGYQTNLDLYGYGLGTLTLFDIIKQNTFFQLIRNLKIHSKGTSLLFPNDSNVVRSRLF